MLVGVNFPTTGGGWGWGVVGVGGWLTHIFLSSIYHTVFFLTTDES